MDDRPGLSEAAWAAVSSPQRLAVLLLLETGSFSVADVATALDLKRPLALYHLQGLESAGLVRESSRVAVSGGPRIFYAATRTGWAALVGQLNKLARAPDS